MTAASEKGCIQIVSYIKRNPALSPAQFYEHWEKVHAPKVIPWAEKHGILRYQQIHTSGSIVPVPATESAPNAISRGELPTTPVEFDGIAIFLVPSLQQFNAAFEDPYYLEVIEVDERFILDKNGPGNGVIASFNGRMIDMMQQGKTAIGHRGEEYREAWEGYEKKTRL
ncbi:hypothetical protein K458DRAFT_420915 [Lentithecium fluviatile CBS 122367]|uniref:EthD domain-containing protein n=1 Tax=Lentithecium fluviatile CBS 122367 TaxID=1168545 RepID=A0A6G1IRY5_9PLEO|nr:hypothetical protein K458DRAFT_420915 [Lentithecium fluviatile CBS 122367]